MWIEEIAAKMVTDGVGALNTVIFCTSGAQVPPKTKSLVIVDTGGAGSSKTQTDTGTVFATASLTSRGVSHREAYDLAWAAYQSLGADKGLYNFTIDSTPYLSLKARQMPTDLGKDAETGLAVVVFNIEAEKALS